MLPMAGLGAAGLFPAFAAAIFAVETLHAFARRQWGIKLSGGAPDVVVRSFAALLPTVTCVVLVWFVVHVLGIDLASGITAIVRPLIHGGDSLAAVVIVVLIDSALWLVGVHGVSVLAAVRPLWLAALAENMAAASAGQPPPHVFTQEFFIWFVWQGGSGTTLAFALMLLFAKSKQLRLVGKAGIVPAIFNINEPLLFGAPVVMNGKLAPPFVLAPTVLVVLSWCAMRFGIVRPPYIEVVWTLPATIGAYLSSGGDPKRWCCRWSTSESRSRSGGPSCAATTASCSRRNRGLASDRLEPFAPLTSRPDGASPSTTPGPQARVRRRADPRLATAWSGPRRTSGT